MEEQPLSQVSSGDLIIQSAQGNGHGEPYADMGPPLQQEESVDFGDIPRHVYHLQLQWNHTTLNLFKDFGPKTHIKCGMCLHCCHLNHDKSIKIIELNMNNRTKKAVYQQANRNTL